MAALDALALAGFQVAVCIVDPRDGRTLARGDERRALRIAGLGMVHVLLEAASRFDQGTLDASEQVESFSLEDLAVVAASGNEDLAANMLRARVDTEVRDVGTAHEYAHLFAHLGTHPGRAAAWLGLRRDLSLAAGATALDPVPRGADHGLTLINRTGRDRGILAEAGTIAGPRAALAYAMIVNFDDETMEGRMRAHDAFRTLGLELMEYVH